MSIKKRKIKLDKTFKVREFNSSDKKNIIILYEKFGDYLEKVDHMRRERRMEGYGEYFTDKMINDVAKNQGKIYVVEYEGEIIGFISGIIEIQSEESLLQCIPSKFGRFTELFVEDKFRGKGIGAFLMSVMEDYFRESGCNVLKVEVFEPNVLAYKFYVKLGYRNRSVDMIKLLN